MQRLPRPHWGVELSPIRASSRVCWFVGATEPDHPVVLERMRREEHDDGVFRQDFRDSVYEDTMRTVIASRDSSACVRPNAYLGLYIESLSAGPPFTLCRSRTVYKSAGPRRTAVT